MAKYPDNMDIQVSYGHLQYYQGRMSDAEKTFQGVLRLSPDYVDAQNGLTSARREM